MLFEKIQEKKSYLCIGLDPDIDKIPTRLLSLPDPIFEFCKKIIDATRDVCVAYKPNIAFFESMGPDGWHSLKKTVEYIGSHHFIIADAKRGDIGNTSALYARTYFDWLHADCVTVNPYMGEDSVRPFLKPNKWIALLVHTSNIGSRDFQLLETTSGKLVFEEVIEKSKSWGDASQIMYVVGATHPETFVQIRRIVPDHFLLVPGIGAQGGDLKKISEVGMNKQCGLLVNASRSIIYASSKEDFADAARREAVALQTKMAEYLNSFLK